LQRLADALDGFEAGAANVVPLRVGDLEVHPPHRGGGVDRLLVENQPDAYELPG
jgi:hypothetical protein